MRFPLAAALLACASATLLQPAIAQTGPSDADRSGIVPGRTPAQPPTIDGRVSPEEWAGFPTFSGLVDAENGTPLDEGGQFWLGYDGRFVYFAARLVDRQPRQIQADEYRTNVSLGGNDAITLNLDPFGQRSEFNSFSVNPRGATSVGIAGGRAPKREWLGEILAAGRITETGWEAEMRIPWEIMRLPSPGVRDLSFNVRRSFRRLQRDYTWRFTSGGRIENFGRWTGVNIPRPSRPPLRLLPFVYGGWDEDEGRIANAGLDFRQGLSKDLDLVGTINPDFRNIENQILSLDFSYTERIRGESRPFFQEGAGFFRTSQDSPLFLSQRVREFDTGVKVYGKLDDLTDLGVLGTFDFGYQTVGAAKLNRRIGPRTTIEGAWVGIEEKGLQNHSSFMAFDHGIGPWFLYGSSSRTYDNRRGVGYRYNAGGWYNQGEWSGGADFVEISPNFTPRAGFAPLRGFRGVGYNVEWDRRLENVKGNGLLEYGVEAGGFFAEKFGGGLFRREYRVSTSTTWANGIDLDLFSNWDEFFGFRDHRYGGSLEFPRGNPYRNAEVSYQRGRISNRDFERFGLGFAYRPIQRLQLSGEFSELSLFGRETQVVIGANYDLGRDQSISGRYLREGNDENMFVSFRRSGNRGAEYFLIVGDPNAPRWRTVVTLKITIPIELRF